MGIQNSTETIEVEVVLAMPDRQELVTLDMKAGSTVAEAIKQSALPGMFEDFKLDLKQVGVFGRKVAPDTVLYDGDRVEIYRPLIADPKEVRRQRALKQAEDSSAD